MRTAREFVVSTLALLVILSSTVLAQGYIDGVVLWRAGEPAVEGVVVTAYDSLNSEIGRDTTDTQGQFEFTLPVDTYHLSFVKSGYRDTTLGDIVVVSGETTQIEIHMKWINNCHYVVGDVNGSNTFNGLDVTYGVRYFKGFGPPPRYTCECTPGHIWYVVGDVNGDCQYTGLDIVYTVGHFKCGYPYSECPDCPTVP
jgi:hypothetical protein